MPASERCRKICCSNSHVCVIFTKQILSLFLYEIRAAVIFTERFGGGGMISKESIIFSISSGRVTWPRFVTIPDHRLEARSFINGRNSHLFNEQWQDPDN